MRIILIGYGKMGHMIEETALAMGDTFPGIIDIYNKEDLDKLTAADADVVMDFSRPDSLNMVCDFVKRTGIPLLSGTTGMTPEQKAQLEEVGNYAPVIWSANYSLGVAVFVRALKEVSSTLRNAGFDIEVTETHHNQKEDAPSGTAKLLVEAINSAHDLEPVYGREGICGKRKANEIGVHALRGGTVAGTHTVHFFGADEEFEITHRAASRKIFVNGALQIAHLLPGKEKGVYDLQKLLFGE